jgi:hypothetical protein
MVFLDIKYEFKIHIASQLIMSFNEEKYLSVFRLWFCTSMCLKKTLFNPRPYEILEFSSKILTF